jgi:hypothetical protein
MPESVAGLPVNAAQKWGVVDDKTRLLVQTDTSQKDVILDYPYPIPELIYVNAAERLKDAQDLYMAFTITAKKYQRNYTKWIPILGYIQMLA